jgi:hypothetical protein
MAKPTTCIGAPSKATLRAAAGYEQYGRHAHNDIELALLATF